MDWNRVAGSWKQLEGKVKAKSGLGGKADMARTARSRAAACHSS